MKANQVPKSSAITFIRNFAAILREEEATGRAIPGFHVSSQDREVRRTYWRRASSVQAAYDNAPAGAELIAAAVMRKLLSFRPKLSSKQMDDLTSTKFRQDVSIILNRKIGALRAREHEAIEAADDARRAKRRAAKPAARNRRTIAVKARRAA